MLANDIEARRVLASGDDALPSLDFRIIIIEFFITSTKSMEPKAVLYACADLSKRLAKSH